MEQDNNTSNEAEKINKFKEYIKYSKQFINSLPSENELSGKLRTLLQKRFPDISKLEIKKQIDAFSSIYRNTKASYERQYGDLVAKYEEITNYEDYPSEDQKTFKKIINSFYKKIKSEGLKSLPELNKDRGIFFSKEGKYIKIGPLIVSSDASTKKVEIKQFDSENSTIFYSESLSTPEVLLEAVEKCLNDLKSSANIFLSNDEFLKIIKSGEKISINDLISKFIKESDNKKISGLLYALTVLTQQKSIEKIKLSGPQGSKKVYNFYEFKNGSYQLAKASHIIAKVIRKKELKEQKINKKIKIMLKG